MLHENYKKIDLLNNQFITFSSEMQAGRNLKGDLKLEGLEKESWKQWLQKLEEQKQRFVRAEKEIYLHFPERKYEWFSCLVQIQNSTDEDLMNVEILHRTRYENYEYPNCVEIGSLGNNTSQHQFVAINYWPFTLFKNGPNTQILDELTIQFNLFDHKTNRYYRYTTDTSQGWKQTISMDNFTKIEKINFNILQPKEKVFLIQVTIYYQEHKKNIFQIFKDKSVQFQKKEEQAATASKQMRFIKKQFQNQAIYLSSKISQELKDFSQYKLLSSQQNKNSSKRHLISFIESNSIERKRSEKKANSCNLEKINSEGLDQMNLKVDFNLQIEYPATYLATNKQNYLFFQGNRGICAFAATLKSLIDHYHNFLDKIFLFVLRKEDGRYNYLKLHVEGEQLMFVIESMVCLDKHQLTGWSFEQSQIRKDLIQTFATFFRPQLKNTMMVNSFAFKILILFRAWALLSHGYKETEGGNVCDAFIKLTGIIPTVISISKTEIFRENQLIKSKKKIESDYVNSIIKYYHNGSLIVEDFKKNHQILQVLKQSTKLKCNDEENHIVIIAAIKIKPSTQQEKNATKNVKSQAEEENTNFEKLLDHYQIDGKHTFSILRVVKFRLKRKQSEDLIELIEIMDPRGGEKELNRKIWNGRWGKHQLKDRFQESDVIQLNIKDQDQIPSQQNKLIIRSKLEKGIFLLQKYQFFLLFTNIAFIKLNLIKNDFLTKRIFISKQKSIWIAVKETLYLQINVFQPTKQNKDKKKIRYFQTKIYSKTHEKKFSSVQEYGKNSHLPFCSFKDTFKFQKKEMGSKQSMRFLDLNYSVHEIIIELVLDQQLYNESVKHFSATEKQQFFKESYHMCTLSVYGKIDAFIIIKQRSDLQNLRKFKSKQVQITKPKFLSEDNE